ncbi:MAG: AAA family ATPase [Bacilli bacterium]|nr:AAA family ATPase [Bacilli bacterium]
MTYYGKNIQINHYWEGVSQSQKEVNCKTEDLPTVNTPYKELKCGVAECHKLEDYKEFVSEANDGVSSCVRIDKNGKTMIGQYERGNFNGVVLESGEHNKIIISKYVEGYQDDSFLIIANTNNQTIEFKYKNKEGNYCSINYDAGDALNSLVLTHRKENGEQIDSVVVSNPQMDSTTIVKKASDNEDGKSCEEKLNELIGLENVKKMIKRLKALLVKNKTENAKPNLNMFFTGNPGTGKTEVARLLAGILYDNGIIKENKFIEVDRSGLVGRYVGESEKNTDQIIKNALGGVLFIDEAYSLYTGWDDKDYGNQVMDKLVKAMEDNKGNICVIFAGYKDAMEKLYSMNQGLASRINRKIDFPNYSVDELKQIANKFLADNNYKIDDDAMKEITEIMESRLSDKNFANARDVRNVLEAVYEIQAERTSEDSNNRTISIEDVQTYEEEAHVIKAKKDDKTKYFVNYNQIKEICLNKTDFNFNEQYVQEASVNIKILDKAFGNVVSEGSGFFITPDGLIGTCAHVIKDAKFIRIVVNIFTSKGKKITKTYNANIVGLDEKTDCGLIKIENPGEYEFSYYPIENGDILPNALDEVVMGGYPLGGERFEKISINIGRVQSYNKDQALGDESAFDKIYVDLTGSAGNSGSGVISKTSGRCIGIYAGASLGYSSNVQFKLNYSIPTKYLWDLLKKCSEEEKGE